MFLSIGTYRFEADGQSAVTFQTQGTEDGLVVADGVQFVPAWKETDNVELYDIEIGVGGESRRASDDDPKYEIHEIPEQLKGLSTVTTARGNGHQPASGFAFTIDEDSDVYIAVHDRGGYKPPEGWTKTDMTLKWLPEKEETDTVYTKSFSKGVVQIPGHNGKIGSMFGVPNMAFIKSGIVVGSLCNSGDGATMQTKAKQPEALADDWEFVGEAVNEPGWDIWGSSPIITEDGKVHLFVARWPGKFSFNSAWRSHSQIARYTADSPEGPFRFQEVVLKGDGEGWDAQGYHNPNIQKVGDQFALTCIANDGKGRHGPNQRIGIWVADKIDGPWKPANGDPGKPMLAPPEDPAIWCHKSGCGVNNPALLQMPDGSFHLYFKARKGPTGAIKMGLAIAKTLEGPFHIQPETVTTNDRSIEDGYAFHWRRNVCFMTTDNHGILESGGGLLWTSRDGKKFNNPLLGYHHFSNHYFPNGVPKTVKAHYTRQVKCERPQILLINGEPAYLYAPSGTAIDGSDGTNCYLFRRKIKAEAPRTPQEGH
jgi:hypothetical protein